MVKVNTAVIRITRYLGGALLMLIAGITLIACTSANLELKKGPVVAGTLRDGKYIGRANLDWRNAAEVEVTIEKGRIAHIRVIQHKHGPQQKYSADEIVQRILKAQSTAVDAVTGATVSSRVITGAVQDALNKAVLASPE
jgi:uncharacterized protein with FMN-binding domain